MKKYALVIAAAIALVAAAIPAKAAPAATDEGRQHAIPVVANLDMGGHCGGRHHGRS
ncbi:hypothetical protein [Bradyrhizobium sp. WD16]|uniref:hypothetical protein n=1 Tax=Bradyrhizobium sp. WD16 TaxID=1521768 RepID=UPI0020A4F439|nr:hypothetical protein [Bradyrhizobium sp. WD16]